MTSLTGTIPPVKDWTPVLQLASDTLTIGTLASRVLGSDLQAGLPEDVRNFLADVLTRAKERNRRLLAQLGELLPALNAAGVEPIVMRGMATFLQGRDEGRLMSDIDLCVPASSRDVSVQVMRSAGYEIFQGVHGPPFAVVLGRTQDVGMIDLHTEIQPYNLHVNYERLTPLCRRVQLDGGWVLAPTPTCSLLLYILHDQLHDGDYWRGLIDARHLADIPSLVGEGIDWATLQSFFPPPAARNALAVQLRTAKSLTGIDVPKAYCGGAWASMQLKRRQLQLRFPMLRPALTLLTVALDPPKNWVNSSKRKRPLRRKISSKLQRTMGPVSAGKIQLHSR
jgi:hypothetical protein